MKVIQVILSNGKSSVHYQCENCGEHYLSPNAVHHCEVCGNEFCANCGTFIYTYPENIVEIQEHDFVFNTSGDILSEPNTMELDEIHYVCNDCSHKINEQRIKYVQKAQNITENYKQEMKQLTRNYLYGDLNEN